MVEHTSKSWEVEDDVYVVEAVNRDIVAYCGNDFTRDIQESNARLIAAAPDLEKALKMAVVWLYRNKYEYNFARAALAKAKGEK